MPRYIFRAISRRVQSTSSRRLSSSGGKSDLAFVLPVSKRNSLGSLAVSISFPVRVTYPWRLRVGNLDRNYNSSRGSVSLVVWRRRQLNFAILVPDTVSKSPASAVIRRNISDTVRALAVSFRVGCHLRPWWSQEREHRAYDNSSQHITVLDEAKQKRRRFGVYYTYR